jgi:hypothetical protein
MRGWKTILAALAAVLAAGCSGNEKKEEKTFAQTLRGTWVACWNEGTTDVREAVVFDGAAFVARRYGHPTVDASCGGHGVLQDAESTSGSYTVGASVLAPDPEGGASVTAYRIDATGVDSRYTIAYVKTSVTPNVLYVGDDSGANDGTTPALRPTTLQADRPRARAADPMAFPASLQGAFETCANDGMPEGVTDYREVLAFDGTSVDARIYDHATTDGTCGGNGFLRLDGSSFQGTSALGADVPASLGVLGVTATAADVDPALDGSTFYSIVWVDSLASPRTLYVGDDQGLDTTDPAQRPDTLQLQKPRYLLPAPIAFPGLLQGTWVACTFELDDGHDVREVFSFSASMTVLHYDHTTTDGTCGNGAGTFRDSMVFPFTLGGEAAATLGPLGVTARTLDLGTSMYTLAYVDTAARPYALYIGDERATAGLDASAPSKRPTVLQGWKPRFQLH